MVPGDRRHVIAAIAGGAVAVGVLDLLDAFVFFGMRGVAPIRILHSIASGLLGRAAFQGGAPTAALGLLLHFFIATAIVTTFVLASRVLPSLTRGTLVFGPAYGVAVYCVMNFVVIPLSASGRGALTWPVVANGLLIHVIGVGIPSALAARRASIAS